MRPFENIYLWAIVSLSMFCGCKKGDGKTDDTGNVHSFSVRSLTVGGQSDPAFFKGLELEPQIQILFSAPLDKNTFSSSISLADKEGKTVNFTASLGKDDSLLVVQPVSLNPLSSYTFHIFTTLSSVNSHLSQAVEISFSTGIDSTSKFPDISDEDLLNLVQKQTFKYFWDLGHPVSGMARERDSSGEVVTTGGTGFGVMAIVTAIHRGFITREEGLARVQQILTFLKNKAQRFHGAFPHWLNGTTGAVQPFSSKDNGADLVETSFLMEGLLTARQYFNGSASAEAVLRNDINDLWQSVEWSWFRKNNEDVLYWHWSPDYNWDMNMQVKGWNEALITYVLGASSPTYPIPKSVYDGGWAGNGSVKNGASYFGITLPFGPANGGPLFFAHYSFLGLNPSGLSDAYGNYQAQNEAHSRINYLYCQANVKNFYGYSSECWGLTASDDIEGYLAHSPDNDDGVISPTAALSSLPYTPEESMRALKFFYYKLGDRIWGEYGFKDAFSLDNPWVANSYLAIDQGPIIAMIENYRSHLLWNLFMSCQEVKSGLKKLGFSGPNI